MLQLESAGRVLKVSEAKLEDSGKYTCLATNAAGEAQQHLRLSVHGKAAKSISFFFIFLPFISFLKFTFWGLVSVSTNPTLCVCNFLYASQSLPTSPTLETSSTRPSWLVFPLSLNAKPQEVHYLVIWLESLTLPQNPCCFYSVFIFQYGLNRAILLI